MFWSTVKLAKVCILNSFRKKNPVGILIKSFTFSHLCSSDDYCSFDDGTPGVCSIINRCDLVYQQSRVGLQSDKLCGYTESEPVVCCPVEASQTTTETQWTTTISDEQGTIETEGTTQRPINKYDRSIDEGVTLSGNYDKNSHAKPGDLARKSNYIHLFFFNSIFDGINEKYYVSNQLDSAGVVKHCSITFQLWKSTVYVLNATFTEIYCMKTIEL